MNAPVTPGPHNPPRILNHDVAEMGDEGVTKVLNETSPPSESGGETAYLIKMRYERRPIIVDILNYDNHFDNAH